MTPLLCISGKRFAGKDTFAAALQNAATAHGFALYSYAFATECKRLFVAANAARGVAVDLDRLVGDREYKEAWRPRLTQFTVEQLTADPQIFVRSVAAQITTHPTLITDLRLQLELAFLRPRFLVVIARVQRSDEARARSGWVFDASKDQHYTETELDDPSLWTERIDNEGSVEELAAQADALFQRTFMRRAT